MSLGAFFLLVPGVLSGCAVMAPVSTFSRMPEAAMVGQRFAAAMARAEKCPDTLGADFDGLAESWGAPLRFSGFLVASASGSLKVVALHPGGLPFFIFVVRDGRSLSLDIPAMTAQRGKADGVAGSDGLSALGAGISWLLGRSPGAYVVDDVRAAEKDGQYWLFLKTAEGRPLPQILFDPEKGLFLGARQDSGGEEKAELVYSSDHEGCPVPDKIRFRQWGGQVLLELREIERGKLISPGDFSMRIPPGFLVRDTDGGEGN